MRRARQHRSKEPMALVSRCLDDILYVWLQRRIRIAQVVKLWFRR
jgi:hypothetical protein